MNDLFSREITAFPILNSDNASTDHGSLYFEHISLSFGEPICLDGSLLSDYHKPFIGTRTAGIDDYEPFKAGAADTDSIVHIPNAIYHGEAASDVAGQAAYRAGDNIIKDDSIKDIEVLRAKSGPEKQGVVQDLIRSSKQTVQSYPTPEPSDACPDSVSIDITIDWQHQRRIAPEKNGRRLRIVKLKLP